jgi:hypothetical protein
MIEFVAYISTAQDHLGYVVLDGHGVFDSGLVGAPSCLRVFIASRTGL